MQSSFSELEYASKKKQTRQDRFLVEIEAITPRVSLTECPCSILSIQWWAWLAVGLSVWSGYCACMLHNNARSVE
jgi:hypothetical protein